MPTFYVLAVAALLVPAILLRGLRTPWYASHVLLVLGAMWLLNGGQAPQVQSAALQTLLLVHLVSINLLEMVLYIYDKQQAARNGWRIAERTLLAFALIGATPAAFIASRIFRHKNRKASFRVWYWFVLIVQVIAVMTVWLWDK